MFWFGVLLLLFVWGFFWSVSCLVGFGFFVSVGFWGFCLLYFLGLFVGVLLEDQFCWILAEKCPEKAAALFTCCLRII